MRVTNKTHMNFFTKRSDERTRKCIYTLKGKRDAEKQDRYTEMWSDMEKETVIWGQEERSGKKWKRREIHTKLQRCTDMQFDTELLKTKISSGYKKKN